MKVLRALLDSGTFQTIVGFILLAVTIVLISFALLYMLYIVAKEIADRKARREIEAYKRLLDEELEGYKKNIVVETTVDLQIEYGVGYEGRATEHRRHKIRRIS